MATFVLVPGAWLSGAVWDETRSNWWHPATRSSR